jgi:Zn finger protein HypA/HybF involved in hydrogenase expression
MHEYSLVRAMVDRVEREASARSATRSVPAVSIGLSGVEPAVRGLHALSEGSQWAELIRRPRRPGCPACAAVIPAGAVLRCAACGASAKLLSGDEIILDQIEMEVP